MKVIRIDENGYFVEEVVVSTKDDVPEDCIKTLLDTRTKGYYKPMWNGKEWVETMTEEEFVNSLEKTIVEHTLQEKNRADIDYLAIMQGVDL